MNKKQKIIYLYFIILPFIDVITSLITRFTNFPISLGMIIKGATIVFGVLYIFIWSKSKYRKASIYYLVTLCIFGLIYILTKRDIWSISNILNEITYAFRYMYFPIMIPCILNVFEDFKIEKELVNRILLINCFCYTALLLIPYITNTGFDSYRWNGIDGKNGWFYAANETGVITVILLSSTLYFLNPEKKWTVICLVPVLVSIALIGTKVSYLGMIIVTILIVIALLIKYKKNGIITSAALLLIIAIICNFSPAISNLEGSLDRIENEEEAVEEDYKYSTIDDLVKNKTLAKVVKLGFNGREDFFFRNYSVYYNSSITDKLMGLGWSNREKLNYTYERKLIEIDYLDIFIHYGIVGFIVYFLPLIYLFIKVIKEKIKTNIDFWYNLIIFLLGIAISSIAGHVLSAPAVSIYLVLILYLMSKYPTKAK